MTEKRIDIIVQKDVDKTIAPDIRSIGKAASASALDVAKLQAALNALNSISTKKIAVASGGSSSSARGASGSSTAGKSDKAAEREALAAARKAAAEEKRIWREMYADAKAYDRQWTAAKRKEELQRTADARAASSQAVKAARDQQREEARLLRETTAANKREREQQERDTARAARQAEADARKASAAEIAAQKKANAESARALRQQSDERSRASRRNGQQAQNLVYQLNDVVVSLGSGQKPLTVLLQQGSQILTIFGPGKGLMGTLKALGGLLIEVLAPLAPLIAVVAALGAGVFALQGEIKKSTGVAVSFGDTLTAVFQATGDAIMKAWSPVWKSIGPNVTKTWDFVKKTTLDLIINVVAAVKTYYITAFNLVKNFGPIVKDLGVIAWNAVIDTTQNAINTIVRGINYISGFINNAAEAVGMKPIFGEIQLFDLSSWKQQSSGAVATFVEGIGEEFKKQQGIVRKDFQNFFDDISKHAVDNYNKRQKKTKEKKTRDPADKLTFDDIRKELENENEALRVNGDERTRLQAIYAAEKRLKRSLTDDEKVIVRNLIDENIVLKAQDAIWQDVNGGVQEYNTQLKAANELLKKGAITATAFQTTMAKNKLVTDLRGVDKTLTRRPPGGGKTYAQKAEEEELRIGAAEQLKIIEDANRAKIISDEEYARRRLLIQQNLNRDLADLDLQRKQQQLGDAATIFDSLASMLHKSGEKQSAAYKVMFMASKAFTIASSILNINKALTEALALPFPANLPAMATVAAEGASIMANIQAVQGLKGFQRGGYTGSGGTSEIVGVVHGKEYVSDAATTREYMPTLNAMRYGNERDVLASLVGTMTDRPVASSPLAANANTKLNVVVQNFGTSKAFDVEHLSESEIRVIARDEVRHEAPKTFASNMSNPNSRESRALGKNTNMVRNRA